jgi:predicted ATPase
MIQEAWLYAFDEFQVTHISDAMIMKQLFSILFRKGAVVVTTSNRPPADLYLNGLNRPLFVPFIPLLEERCTVKDIASEVDYRLITDYADDAFQVFFHPLTDETNRGYFDDKFNRFCLEDTKKD